MSKKYVTKDSGKRIDYKSGMRRDIADGKPRFDLICAKDQKFDETLLYRWAMLMERGREKYGERNWEKATGEELARFEGSAFRHFMQWIKGVDDGEDHAVAVLFNINCAEFVKQKMKK